ncbi:MAG: hypothetical protein KIT60_15945 [Burkholderiaceae bacterium]|nr:hypothetical protein [Burkholderiaceae bacterium]
MRRACATLLTLGGFVALAMGCVSVKTDEYPRYWPALQVSGAGCPGLTGSFDNRDVDEAQPVPLAKWLLQTADSLQVVHRVQLTGPAAGVLLLRLLDDKGIALLQRELREGTDYECNGGWLERRQPELTLLGVVHRRVARLARTTRGDLVVEESDRGGGVVIVVPMYASFRTWHLYRQRGD